MKWLAALDELAADRGEIEEDEQDEAARDDGELGTDNEMGCLSRSNLVCFRFKLLLLSKSLWLVAAAAALSCESK